MPDEPTTPLPDGCEDETAWHGPQRPLKDRFAGPIGRSEINRMPKSERLKRLNQLRAEGKLDLCAPTERIPPAVMERMNDYLACISVSRSKHEAVAVSDVALSTVRRWRRRFPRFVRMEEDAIANREHQLKQRCEAEWIRRAIKGRVKCVRKNYDKQGNLTSEVETIEWSDPLLIKLINRLWPEQREGAQVQITNNVTSAEVRQDVLVLLEDAEAVAAIRAARDRAILAARRPGEPGPRGDGAPPA